MKNRAERISETTFAYPNWVIKENLLLAKNGAWNCIW